MVQSGLKANQKTKQHWGVGPDYSKSPVSINIPAGGPKVFLPLAGIFLEIGNLFPAGYVCGTGWEADGRENGRHPVRLASGRVLHFRCQSP
jgi:hypothetical protein